LKLSVKAFVPLALVIPFLFTLCFSMMVVPDCGSTACFGLCAGALLDLEAGTTVEQWAQEAAAEVAALTSSGVSDCFAPAISNNMIV
jgi:hypothetical protein